MSSPPRLDDPLELLAAPPQDRYALLELASEWDGLVGVESQLAAALRLFVITRDPLDWIPDRGSAWATSNIDGDVVEIPLYVTRDEVQRRLAATERDLAAAVGPLCETVVLAAARCQGVMLAGAYPELAARGEVPRLLGRQDGPGSLSAPAIAARSTDWEPIGLGAIQDLVQDAFGPVVFDRSKVMLAASDTQHDGCPACAGARFGFPGELAEASAAMCENHRAQADEVTATRIARARSSNPAGWRAIGLGSARISGVSEVAGGPLPRRRHGAPGRNDPCPCGSGRKYKHCCGK